MRKLMVFLCMIPILLLAQPPSWQTLDSLAGEQYVAGTFKKGYTTIQQCLTQIRTDSLPTKQYLPVLLKEAMFVEKLGEYRKADTLIRRVVHLYRAHRQTTNPKYVTALNEYGRVLTLLGDFKVAESYLLQSMMVQKYLENTSSVNYAETLTYLGLLKIDQREFEKAFFLYNNALKKVDSTDVLNALLTMHIGEYFLEQQKPEEALQYLKNANKKIDPKHPNYGILQNHWGRYYELLADYEKAELAFESSLEIKQAIFDNEHPAYNRTLGNLGLLYYNLGNATKAISILEKVMRLYEKQQLQKITFYAEVLNTLGILYTERELHVAEVPAIFEKAGKLFFEKQLYSKYAITRFNLADYYYYSSTPKKAIPYYEQALTFWKKTEEKKQTYAFFCMGLAKAYLINQSFNAADSIITHAANVYSKVSSIQHPDYLYIKATQAKIKEQLGNLESTSNIYYEQAARINFLLQYYYPSLSESERLQFHEVITEQFELIASFLYRYPQQFPKLNQAFQQLNLETKGLALDNSILARQQLKEQLNEEGKKLIFQLQQTRKSIAKYLLLPQKDRKDTQPILDSLQAEAIQLDKQISRLSKNNEKIVKDTPKKFRLNESLTENAAAIDYIRFMYFDGKNWTWEYKYFVMLTKNNSTIPQIILLPEEKTLLSIVEKKATHENSYIRNNLLNQEVYRLVWKPILYFLQNIEEVHIAPDGIINQVAFHALRDSNNVSLLKKYQIYYHNNLKNIQKPNVTGNNREIILIGDIDYNDNWLGNQLYANRTITDSIRGSTFNPLAGTKEEVDTIYRMFQQANWSVKKMTRQVNEMEFKNLLNNTSPNILHIATHGFYFPQEIKKRNFRYKDTGENRIRAAADPLMRAGLALANINEAWKTMNTIETANDGILTAYEITDLNLDKTKLVVLSACDTGLGDYKNGEGVFGLQRAFKAAGAQKMLVSLWKVPDQETKKLMTFFYKYYLSGLSSEKALRQAQLDMEQQYKSFYWAAFVVL